MVCKHWSSHVWRSHRKLGVFAVQKTRKLGMCCVKCNTFERLWEAIMTLTMIPLLYTHIKLRGYAFRCAKIWWYFAHFLHTHAQSVRTQQWLIVDVIIASIVYRDRWWGGTLLSNWPISANFRCRNSLYQKKFNTLWTELIKHQSFFSKQIISTGNQFCTHLHDWLGKVLAAPLRELCDNTQVSCRHHFFYLLERLANYNGNDILKVTIISMIFNWNVQCNSNTIQWNSNTIQWNSNTIQWNSHCTIFMKFSQYSMKFQQH